MSARSDSMAEKIEEEFEKYLYEPLACLDRDDLEFIENDNGCQFISLTEADRVARDNAENGFTAGFHAASKPLMEENERLNNFCKEFVYGEENPEYYKTMDEQIKELREALDLATSQLTGFIDSDKVFTELRLKFNLDNESKGERV